MEYIQCALEDAQYLAAIQQRDVQSTSDILEIVAEHELDLYFRESIASSCGASLICSDSFGFFLFLGFCASRGDKPIARFVENVAKFRKASTEVRSHLRNEIILQLKNSATERLFEGRKDGHDPNSLLSSFSGHIDSRRVEPVPESTQSSSDGVWKPRDERVHPTPPESQAEVTFNDLSLIRPPDPKTQKAAPATTILDSSPSLVSFQKMHAAAAQSETPLSDISCSFPRGDPLAFIPKSEDGDVPTYTFDAVEAVVFEWLRQKHESSFLADKLFYLWCQAQCLRSRPISLESFSVLRPLGRGGFGTVAACVRKHTGYVYAMKKMNRGRIAARHAEGMCLNERNIMATLSSPFVVSLKYAFATKQDLCLVMDLMLGGDLGYWLAKTHVFSPQAVAYHVGRVFLALEHMHQNQIVHRDLKPENILLDESGRSKISDLGLACFTTASMQGPCGTRGYMAPEILAKDASGRRLPYDHMVDWFSFGCLVYAMSMGCSPFCSGGAKQWYASRRVNGEGPSEPRELSRPFPGPSGQDGPGNQFRKGTKDNREMLEATTVSMPTDRVFDDHSHRDRLFIQLCTGLLEKDPSIRLGSRSPSDIANDAWFTSNVPLEAIRHDSVLPPFKPGKTINAHSQLRIGEFDDVEGDLTDQDKDMDSQWYYVAKNALPQELVYCNQMHRDRDEAVKSQYRSNTRPSRPGCCGIS